MRHAVMIKTSDETGDAQTSQLEVNGRSAINHTPLHSDRDTMNLYRLKSHPVELNASEQALRAITPRLHTKKRESCQLGKCTHAKSSAQLVPRKPDKPPSLKPSKVSVIKAFPTAGARRRTASRMVSDNQYILPAAQLYNHRTKSNEALRNNSQLLRRNNPIQGAQHGVASNTDSPSFSRSTAHFHQDSTKPATLTSYQRLPTITNQIAEVDPVWGTEFESDEIVQRVLLESMCARKQNVSNVNNVVMTQDHSSVATQHTEQLPQTSANYDDDATLKRALEDSKRLAEVDKLRDAQTTLLKASTEKFRETELLELAKRLSLDESRLSRARVCALAATKRSEVGDRNVP